MHMTDKQIERIIESNMPLLDLPDCLSTENIYTRLEEVTPIRKVSMFSSRNIKIAASFILVAVGIMSFLITNGRQKSDFGMANDMGQDFEIYEKSEEEAAVEYKEEMLDNFDEVTSENTYMVPSVEAGGASVYYDKEYEIIIGKKETIELVSGFGKSSEICYYDINGNEISQDILDIDWISSDEGEKLTVTAIKPGTFTVEISNMDSTYRIKIVALEE